MINNAKMYVNINSQIYNILNINKNAILLHLDIIHVDNSTSILRDC